MIYTRIEWIHQILRYKAAMIYTLPTFSRVPDDKGDKNYRHDSSIGSLA